MLEAIWTLPLLYVMAMFFFWPLTLGGAVIGYGLGLMGRRFLVPVLGTLAAACIVAIPMLIAGPFVGEILFHQPGDPTGAAWGAAVAGGIGFTYLFFVSWPVLRRLRVVSQ